MRRRMLAVCLAFCLMALGGCDHGTKPEASAGPSSSAAFHERFMKTAADVDPRTFGAAADAGAADDQAFEQAVDAVQKTGGRLILTPGVYRLEQTFTFPAEVTVVFQPGAVLYTERVQTVVTFQGAIEAGNSQLFDGEGRVVLETVASGNPVWFGAKGDGVTDDTAAFVRALYSFNELRIPYTPEGYVITSLNSFRNMALIGEAGRPVPIKATGQTQALIHVQNGKGFFRLENLAFDLSAAPDGSSAIFLDTTHGTIEYIHIADCTFDSAYYLLTDARGGENANSISDLRFENVVCRDSRCSTIYAKDFEGCIYFKNFTIDNSRSAQKYGLTQAFPLMEIEDVRGCILEDVTLIGTGLPDDREIGMNFLGNNNAAASIWFEWVQIRNTGGFAVRMTTNYVNSLIDTSFIGCNGGLCASGAMVLQISGLTVDGTGSSGSHPGVWLSNARDVQLKNLNCQNMGGVGLLLQRCTRVVSSDCILKNNQKAGYYDFEGEQNLLTRSECSGNGEAQVILQSASGRAEQITVRTGEVKAIDGPGRID